MAKRSAKSFTEALKSGRREAYEALRDEIAAEIESGVPARDLASLSRRLMQVIDALDEMSDGEEESSADRIAKRRAQRRAKAASGE